jgi:hypothetical protein
MGQSAPARGTPKAHAPWFNPFASFSLNRFSFNPFGVLQVGPSNAARTMAAATVAGGGEDEGGEVVMAAAAVRPPYRPPVRSPYRPPPRPPF